MLVQQICQAFNQALSCSFCCFKQANSHMFWLLITPPKNNGQCKHIINSFGHPKFKGNSCKMTFCQCKKNIQPTFFPLALVIFLVKTTFQRRNLVLDINVEPSISTRYFPETELVNFLKQLKD